MPLYTPTLYHFIPLTSVGRYKVLSTVKPPGCQFTAQCAAIQFSHISDPPICQFYCAVRKIDILHVDTDLYVFFIRSVRK